MYHSNKTAAAAGTEGQQQKRIVAIRAPRLLGVNQIESRLPPIPQAQPPKLLNQSMEKEITPITPKALLDWTNPPTETKKVGEKLPKPNMNGNSFVEAEPKKASKISDGAEKMPVSPDFQRLSSSGIVRRRRKIGKNPQQQSQDKCTPAKVETPASIKSPQKCTKATASIGTWNHQCLEMPRIGNVRPTSSKTLRVQQNVWHARLFWMW